MSFLELTGNSLASIVKGLRITLRNLVQWRSRVQTVMYPEERPKLTDRTRGLPVVDMERCIGCLACEKICPNKLIKMETKPSAVKGKRDVIRFDLDYALCMLCNLCEDVCPTDPVPEYRAIALRPAITVVDQRRRDLQQSIGGRFISPAPPEDREDIQPLGPEPKAKGEGEEKPAKKPAAKPAAESAAASDASEAREAAKAMEDVALKDPPPSEGAPTKPSEPPSRDATPEEKTESVAGDGEPVQVATGGDQ
ncbi:MAG TPA: 4Fe-4S binding protein [Armatimonadota bacterium]